MPKSKWKLNTIYISERLQESLRPISRCALTTVVAPMGYGKTTAVNWYLEERAKAGPLRVVRDLLAERAGRLCPRGHRPAAGVCLSHGCRRRRPAGGRSLP